MKKMAYVRLVDMPVTVKALVHLNEDDTYTVLLNSRLSYEQNVSSYQHEMQHIEHDDLYSIEDADAIERKRHEGA